MIRTSMSWYCCNPTFDQTTSTMRTHTLSATTRASLAIGVLVALCAGGCEDYDAPPRAEMAQPEGGAFVEGTPVVLTFSEPVDPGTLKFRVWDELRDPEGDLSEDAPLRVEECDATADACGEVAIERVEEDGGITELSLLFDPAGLGGAGGALVLELLPGIADLQGRDTGPSLFFGVQFRLPPSRVNEEPVEFQDGTYTLVGQATLGAFKAVLRLVCDIKVHESGEFFFAAAEANPIGDAPNNTGDPKELEIDTSDLGWSVYATGFVQLRDGRRLLESDKFDVFVPLGSIEIRLSEVRLIGEIVEDDDGNDRIDGSLSYQAASVKVGNKTTEFESGSAPLATRYVPEEDVPAGGAKICGPLCGDVTGYCAPPPTLEEGVEIRDNWEEKLGLVCDEE